MSSSSGLPPRQIPKGEWRKSCQIFFFVLLVLLKKDELFHWACWLKKDDLFRRAWRLKEDNLEDASWGGLISEAELEKRRKA